MTIFSRLTRPLPFWLTVTVISVIGGASLFMGWRQAEFVDVKIFTDLSQASALVDEGAFWLGEHQPGPLEHRRATALEEFSRARAKLEEARMNIDLGEDALLQQAIDQAVEGVEGLHRLAADPDFWLDQGRHARFDKEHLATSMALATVTQRALKLRQAVLSDYQVKLGGLALATLVLTLISFRIIMSMARQEVSAQREYAQLQERYRFMVEGIRDILFIYQIEPERRFVYVSPGIEGLFGASAEEHYRDPRLWHNRVAEETLLDDVLSGSHPAHAAHQFTLRDEKETRWLEMAVTPFSDKGGVVTMLGIVRDVTDHRRAQEQLRYERDRAEEATRMKDKFVALVSHDIRSPLSSLLGLLTLLARRDDTFLLESGRMILEKSINSGRHLLELSNQLLGLARIQAGAVSPQKEPVDLSERAKGGIELLEGAASGKEVTVENRLPSGMVTTGDPLLLGQVLQNLLSNALKFTPRHGKIVVGGEKREGEIQFWVEDNGVGVAPDLIDGLFDAAVSRSTLGTEQERGVGFGLPLVREIVEAHGGTIVVDSRQGEGSRFTVTLPTDA